LSAYLELKLAWELYQRPPQQLAAAESAKLAAAAARQRLLEAKILSSPEAAQAVVTPAAVAARLAEIRARYPDDETFSADLRGIGLDLSGLEAEIARDLRIEGVLDHVSASEPPATAIDAEIFYRVHHGRFMQPERRTLRHILVTFANDAEKQAALALLSDLRKRIATADDFGDCAMRHSHCPTALEGGVLGTLPRGKLYAELDDVAFTLGAGELSAPVETTVGLHLLRCDEIHPAITPAFGAVRQRILERLNDARRNSALKEWIRNLPGTDPVAARQSRSRA
jgi:peptidylprolyl isomerase/peptidyl-prolyl cis-trans isomerase C